MPENLEVTEIKRPNKDNKNFTNQQTRQFFINDQLLTEGDQMRIAIFPVTTESWDDDLKELTVTGQKLIRKIVSGLIWDQVDQIFVRRDKDNRDYITISLKDASIWKNELEDKVVSIITGKQ